MDLKGSMNKRQYDREKVFQSFILKILGIIAVSFFAFFPFMVFIAWLFRMLNGVC